MLDYRLKTFLLLSKTLNYTKTAEQLHMSQPAVSQHIRYLEQSYGFKLFEYNHRRLQLTETGKQLYRKALSLEVQSQRIIEQLSQRQKAHRRLRFDCTFTFGEYILPPLLCRWMQEKPQTELCVRINNTSQCLEAREEGSIDFALVEGFFEKSRFDNQLIKQTHMGLVVPPHHPLCEKEEVHLSDLIGYPLIIRQKESRMRGILPTGLAEHNYSYESFPAVIQCGSMNVMKTMIQAGCGIGFLHEDIIAQDVRDGLLAEIPVVDFHLRRELNLVYLKDHVDPDLIQFVYHEITSHLQKIGTD